jgi:putative ABC transport system permease protein
VPSARIRLRGEESEWNEVLAGAGVVTRSPADRFWPGQDPIGKGLRGNGSQPPFYRVVAVAEPVRLAAVDEPILEAAFFPSPIDGAGLWVPPLSATSAVRTAGRPPLDLVPSLTAAVSGIDRDVSLAQVQTPSDRVARSDSRARTSFMLSVVRCATT